MSKSILQIKPHIKYGQCGLHLGMQSDLEKQKQQHRKEDFEINLSKPVGQTNQQTHGPQISRSLNRLCSSSCPMLLSTPFPYKDSQQFEKPCRGERDQLPISSTRSINKFFFWAEPRVKMNGLSADWVVAVWEGCLLCLLKFFISFLSVLCCVGWFQILFQFAESSYYCTPFLLIININTFPIKKMKFRKLCNFKTSKYLTSQHFDKKTGSLITFPI